MCCSMLEIYNEACRDLLSSGPDALKPMEVSFAGASPAGPLAAAPAWTAATQLLIVAGCS